MNNHQYEPKPGKPPMPPCAVCGVTWWQHDETPEVGGMNDYAEVDAIVRHLMVDYALGAPADHLERLYVEALDGPRKSYLVICCIASLTAHVMRAAWADKIALTGEGTMWGLEVDTRAEYDPTDPSIRARLIAAQCLVAALNEDEPTVAALVLPAVRLDAAFVPFLLTGVLSIFSQLYNTPEGRAGWHLIKESL